MVIFFKTTYNKTISGFGFCDILNNQDLGECYQPRSNNCLAFEHNLYVGFTDIDLTSISFFVEHSFAMLFINLLNR